MLKSGYIDMAEHIWSIICSKSSVDSETNNISLFEILEQVNISRKKGFPEIEEGKHVGIQFNCEVVTLIARSDLTKPELVDVRIRLVLPTGTVITQPKQTISLLDHLRFRQIVRVNNFPYAGPGEYSFCVDILDQNGEATEKARIPVIFEEVVEESSSGPSEESGTDNKDDVAQTG